MLQFAYSAPVEEYRAMVYVKRRNTFHVDSSPDLYGELLSSGPRDRFFPGVLKVFFPVLSNSVQLLRGPIRLQSLSHG